MRSVRSWLNSAPSTMKIVLALTAFTLASSFAACMAKEDTDASESEFQSADRDKMPDLPYFNR